MRLGGESSNSNGSSKPSWSGSQPTPLLKSTNGAHAAPTALNGSSPNGYSNKVRPTYYGHDRQEVTRILIQSLRDMGYNAAAASLSQESGYDLESPSATAFREAVIQGEWAEAEEFLIGGSAAGGSGTNGSGLVLLDGIDKNVIRFWLRQQKFLELLEQCDTGRALMVLRSELTPLSQDTSKLHFLSR